MNYDKKNSASCLMDLINYYRNMGVSGLGAEEKPTFKNRIVLQSNIYEEALNTLNDYASYYVLFCRDTMIRFRSDSIECYFPLEKGRIVSSTTKYTLDIFIVRCFISCGLHKSLSGRNLFYAMIKDYQYLKSHFESDIMLDEGSADEHIALIEKTLDYMFLGYDSINDIFHKVDNHIEELANFLDNASRLSLCDDVLFNGDGDIGYVTPYDEKSFASFEFDGYEYEAINENEIICSSSSITSFPLDIGYLSTELQCSQAIVKLNLETSAPVSISAICSLYPRNLEIIDEIDLKRRMDRYTRYVVSKNVTMWSRVLDLSEERNRYYKNSNRHRKLEKFNLRRYVYFNIMCIGICRIKVFVMRRGTSREKIDARAYSGPDIVAGQPVWNRYNFPGSGNVRPTPMTSIRLEFLKKKRGKIKKNDHKRSLSDQGSIISMGKEVWFIDKKAVDNISVVQEFCLYPDVSRTDVSKIVRDSIYSALSELVKQ